MNPETHPDNFEYIGDGVYVTFDGYVVWAMTLRDNGWHEIAFEPTVMNNLVNFFQRQEIK